MNTSFVDFSTKDRSQFIQQPEEFINETERREQEKVLADPPIQQVVIPEEIEPEIFPSGEIDFSDDDAEQPEEQKKAPVGEGTNSVAQAEELEIVMNNGMQFLTGLFKMATGKEMGIEHQTIEVNKETGINGSSIKLLSKDKNLIRVGCKDDGSCNKWTRVEESLGLIYEKKTARKTAGIFNKYISCHQIAMSQSSYQPEMNIWLFHLATEKQILYHEKVYSCRNYLICRADCRKFPDKISRCLNRFNTMIPPGRANPSNRKSPSGTCFHIPQGLAMV